IRPARACWPAWRACARGSEPRAPRSAWRGWPWRSRPQAGGDDERARHLPRRRPARAPSDAGAPVGRGRGGRGGARAAGRAARGDRSLLVLAFTHRWRDIQVLVSQHRDGEWIARILSRMGYGLARGSSRRGGAEALFRLATLLERGRDVAITVDGPVGPRYIV